MADERVLERAVIQIRELDRMTGPPGPPGADGDTGSTDPATAAVSGTVKVNTDDPGDDPIVYRKGEVDTLLGAKATSAALTTEAADRAAGDLALESAIEDESDARIAGDSALDVRLDPLELAPPAHTHPESEITGLVADLAAKAPLASPALTGTPTAPTATAGTNTTQLATTAYVIAAIAALINAAPGALDTLDELAAALGDDANFAATVTTALAGKQSLDAELTALAGLVSAANKLPYFTGSGTAALADLSAFARTLLDDGDAATARATLGAASQVDLDAVEDASIAADALLDGRLDTFEANANLTALMALVGASDRAAYFTGAGALSLYTLTAFGRTLAGLADAAALRTAGGLVIGTDVAAQGDARFPTADEKAALTGAGGVPTATNPYVTTTDPRLIAPPSVSAGTYLVSGATIAWKTALTFTVGAATYYLDGVLKASVETDVTLSAADATNPRIDVLVLDATGPTKVTGTAAASPAEPSVDPSLYLRLGLVNVAAGVTAIAVTETSLYKEGTGGDWTGAAVGSGVTIGSTSNPRTGTKDIEGTNVAAGSGFTLTIPSASIDLSTQDKLVFYVRVKAAWATKKALALTWMAGGVTKGSTVTVGNGLYGFNSQSVGAYQQIVVPMSAFSVPAGSAITKLQVLVTGSGANVGFYADDLITQAGFTQGTVSQYRWRGDWISSAAYDQNDEVRRSGGTYLALQASTGQDPATQTAYWANTAALLASPVFTGTPTLPTGTIAVTQSAGDSSQKPATTAFVAAAIAGVSTLATSLLRNAVDWDPAGCPNTVDATAITLLPSRSYTAVAVGATGTSTARPTFETNEVHTSLPIARFDGSNDFLTTITNFSTLNGLSVFIVAKQNSKVAYGTVLSGLSSGNLDLQFAITTGKLGFVRSNVAAVLTQTSTPAAGYHLWEAYFDGVSEHEIVFDGTSDGTASSAVAYGNVSVIGKNGFSNDQFLACDVARIVVFLYLLPSADKATVRAALRAQYGV